jgi:hypothetical protein
MSEREADRCRPSRLRVQAVVALADEARRELSPEFRAHLTAQDARPTLFGTSDLAALARSALEVQVVQNLENSIESGANALAAALRERSEGYVREQKCRLVADRESCATLAAECVRNACDGAADEAAALILTNQRAPANSNRVQLGEDLLGGLARGGAR